MFLVVLYHCSIDITRIIRRFNWGVYKMRICQLYIDAKNGISFIILEVTAVIVNLYQVIIVFFSVEYIAKSSFIMVQPDCVGFCAFV